MSTNFDFTGKVVVVTGAGSGIGLAAARAFAESGANVVLADIDLPSVHKAVERLKTEGFEALAVHCDVTNEESVKSMVDTTVSTYGHLDIAYNNAGVQCEVAETAKLSTASFDRVLSINLRGIWLCMKYELQQMSRQGEGAIVNCSSLMGVVATPGLGAYVASKRGVVGITKCAALEYADKGIRINAICPGSTDTPMVARALVEEPETMKASIEAIPMKRIARVEEMVSAVLWLCSPGAGFMVGQAITPDGGYSVC